MNSIALTGNATKDFELKYTPGGVAIAAGTIAVRRDFKNKQSGEYDTDFINLKAFGKTAELICEWVRKGDKFGVNGRLQIDTYDKDGQRQYFTSVAVSNFDFPDKKRNEGQTQQQNYTRTDEDPFSTGSGPIEVSDDDLPF